MNKPKTYFVFRSSRTGRFISKKHAARLSKATWERERRKRK